MASELAGCNFFGGTKLTKLKRSNLNTAYLVHGHQMACLLDSQEGKTLIGLDLSCGLAGDNPSLLGGLDEVFLFCIERLKNEVFNKCQKQRTYLARPPELGNPGLTANPVADEVLLAIISQDTIIRLSQKQRHISGQVGDLIKSIACYYYY